MANMVQKLNNEEEIRRAEGYTVASLICKPMVRPSLLLLD